MAKKMIVKVQVPVSSNVPADQDLAMVYNEDRSFTKYVPVAHVAQKMGKAFKKFFWCEDNGVTFKLLDEATWQV